MIGYYLFVCMIYVIVIFLVYMGHCYYYSMEIFVVDYDIYHCLLLMIYVLGLAIYSKLCRGVYAVMLFTPLHIITNVSRSGFDIDCIYVVSYWPSLDVKVILFQTYAFFITGTFRS